MEAGRYGLGRPHQKPMTDSEYLMTNPNKAMAELHDLANGLHAKPAELVPKTLIVHKLDVAVFEGESVTSWYSMAGTFEEAPSV